MKTIRYAASKGQGAVTVGRLRFAPGQEHDVSEELAKELLSGADHLSGFKFEQVGAEQTQNAPESEVTTGSDT